MAAFHSGTFLHSTVSAMDGVSPSLLFDGVITTMKVYDFQDTYLVTVLPEDCSRGPTVRHRRASPGSLDSDATSVSCMLVVYDHVGSRPVSRQRLACCCLPCIGTPSAPQRDFSRLNTPPA